MVRLTTQFVPNSTDTSQGIARLEQTPTSRHAIVTSIGELSG